MHKKTRATPVRLRPHKAVDELVLKTAYRRNPHAPAKELAAAAGCDARTAESWWERKTAPGKPHLMRLMRSWGWDFALEVLEIVFVETEEEARVRDARRRTETDELRRRIKALYEASHD